MRYDSRLGVLNGKPRPGGLRSTLCISSQVGDAYLSDLVSELFRKVEFLNSIISVFCI